MEQTALSGVLIFSSYSHRQCVTVSGMKHSASMLFYVTLDTSTNRILLDPNPTVVKRVDRTEGKKEILENGKRKKKKEMKKGNQIMRNQHA